MQERNIDYDEFDFKAEGKDAFNKFYRENRKDIYRDKDGVAFPVFTDGSAIRQGVSVVIGYLIAGDRLKGFINLSALHGEWIDGFDLSGGEPAHTEELLQVLAFLKQNGYKIQVTADGRNATVLEQVIEKGLTDRVIMAVRGPAALYEALAGMPVSQQELNRSIALTARCQQYRFYTPVAPLVRADGTAGFLVMLGALMAAGDIPLEHAALRKAIETRTKKAFVDANLKCFELGL
jgi:pyruvate formate lyase activating enzyme